MFGYIYCMVLWMDGFNLLMEGFGHWIGLLILARQIDKQLWVKYLGRLAEGLKGFLQIIILNIS